MPGNLETFQCEELKSFKQSLERVRQASKGTSGSNWFKDVLKKEEGTLPINNTSPITRKRNKGKQSVDQNVIANPEEDHNYNQFKSE
jgi:hypothetical protein